MSNTIKHNTRRYSAFTLIETIITMVVLLLVITGMWRFRYEAALQAERGQQIAAAGRIANLVCQSWSTVKGANTFNPALCNFDSSLIFTSTSATTVTNNNLNGFTPLGEWTVQTPDRPFVAALFYQNDVATPGLRTLRVLMEWKDSRKLSSRIELCTQTATY